MIGATTGMPPGNDASAWRPQGRVTGIGSLPHRSAHAAARFALSCGDIPAVPTLPRRSPAEGMISQALAGLPGVSVGQYGALAVDVGVLAANGFGAATSVDLDGAAFRGWRAFLDTVATVEWHGPVKWQFVGPVTLGIALARAGVPSPEAFELAGQIVRGRLVALHAAMRAAMPRAGQLVFIDEPSFAAVGGEDFDIAPDTAVDLLSSALASVEGQAVVGVHCCGSGDIGSLLASGPSVLSIPLAGVRDEDLTKLARFIEHDGVIAWGAVTTAGPMTVSLERPWRQLCDVWCQLVQRGADPCRLRLQSLITPECGLAMHTPSLAESVFAAARELARRVGEQATATQFAFGA